MRNAERGVRQNQLARGFHSALRNPRWSRFRLGLAQAGDLVADFALTALFEERGAFKPLEDIALATEGGCGAEAAML